MARSKNTSTVVETEGTQIQAPEETRTPAAQVSLKDLLNASNRATEKRNADDFIPEIKNAMLSEEAREVYRDILNSTDDAVELVKKALTNEGEEVPDLLLVLHGGTFDCETVTRYNATRRIHQTWHNPLPGTSAQLKQYIIRFVKSSMVAFARALADNTSVFNPEENDYHTRLDLAMRAYLVALVDGNRQVVEKIVHAAAEQNRNEHSRRTAEFNARNGNSSGNFPLAGIRDAAF